jgi:hypothetical protein
VVFDLATWLLTFELTFTFSAFSDAAGDLPDLLLAVMEDLVYNPKPPSFTKSVINLFKLMLSTRFKLSRTFPVYFFFNIDPLVRIIVSDIRVYTHKLNLDLIAHLWRCVMLCEPLLNC